MRRKSCAASLAPLASLPLWTSLATAASLDLNVAPGTFTADAPPADQRISSGLDLKLQNPLLDMTLDYRLHIALDDDNHASGDNTAQHIDARLNSRLLNRLLGVRSQMRAVSTLDIASGGYRHIITPRFSHRLADLATVDVNYQLLWSRAAASSVERQQHSYSMVLRGSMQKGRLNWSGSYSAEELYRDRPQHSEHSESRETIRLHSNYRILSEVQVELSTAFTHKTRYRAAADIELETAQLGVDLTWQPHADYALQVGVQQNSGLHNNDEVLLRRGSLSWFPLRDVSLSLNYGDQLVEGDAGVLLNTEVLLDAW